MNRPLLNEVTNWDNLLLAFHKAAKGKRSKDYVAKFEFDMADKLLELQRLLVSGEYQPGAYHHFHISQPKRRLISAAPFADRVVHHAMCQVIEPVFDASFIPTSYANRKGKGTHAAIERFQLYCRQYKYVLRADIQQHFASIDHENLKSILSKQLRDTSLDRLIDKILDRGPNSDQFDYQMQWFNGDDLLALCRPRGLPIGNLTSQFWSNCYLNPFDHFVKRELGCKPYLRYVDDFALFSNDKLALLNWRQAMIDRLTTFRLKLHESSCQVTPVEHGIPWLGMVIYPNKRKLKARKARYATKHLSSKYKSWKKGEVSFAELDASVKGWVNHANHADTWNLRKTVLARASTVSNDR